MYTYVFLKHISIAKVRYGKDVCMNKGDCLLPFLTKLIRTGTDVSMKKRNGVYIHYTIFSYPLLQSSDGVRIILGAILRPVGGLLRSPGGSRSSPGSRFEKYTVKNM